MSQRTLDRDAFKKQISVLAVSVPAEKASSLLKSQELKGCARGLFAPHSLLTTGTCRSIINIPKTKSVVQDPSSPDMRLVLFRVADFGQFHWIHRTCADELHQASRSERTRAEVSEIA